MVWNCPPYETGQSLGDPLPWVNLEEIYERALSWSRTAKSRWVVLAIGLVAADVAEQKEAAKSKGINTEIEVQPNWEFLGFDVADGVCISGLCNCGYNESEATILRREWGHRLNAHGLFSNVVDALAFRQLTDERVPEHAPFFIYELWILNATYPSN